MNVKLITTMEYHLQTSGRVKRFNKTLVAKLCHYVHEHQRICDVFIQSLTYGQNTWVDSTTKTLSFNRVLSMPLLERRSWTVPQHRKILYSYAHHRTKLKVIKRKLHLQRQTENVSWVAHESYARRFEKKVRCCPVFKVGEWISVDRAPVWKKKTTEVVEKNPLRKPVPKAEGSYQILKVHGHDINVSL